MCVMVWYNYGGPSEFMKTMDRMYTLAPKQLGTFNITHTVGGAVDGGLLYINSFLDCGWPIPRSSMCTTVVVC